MCFQRITTSKEFGEMYEARCLVHKYKVETSSKSEFERIFHILKVKYTNGKEILNRSFKTIIYSQ